MQHIIVFSYIFTILIGVSALTIQWLAGKGGEETKKSAVMTTFVSMLLILNVYDFFIYYYDHIIQGASNNLILSFGDCLIAVLVMLWLMVQRDIGESQCNESLVTIAKKFIIVYLIVWLIAVAFFIEQSWIRLIIDIPLVLLLIIGSGSIILAGHKQGEKRELLIYKGILTVLITGTYLLYLISESGLVASSGNNIMDMTIFLWLGINAINMGVMYKHDFAVSYLNQQEPVIQVLNIDEVLSVMKETYELTKRECEILQEVYEGKSNTQIAENLFISESTVKAHLYNIFRKLNVKSRVEAVCIMREARERN